LWSIEVRVLQTPRGEGTVFPIPHALFDILVVIIYLKPHRIRVGTVAIPNLDQDLLSPFNGGFVSQGHRYIPQVQRRRLFAVLQPNAFVWFWELFDEVNVGILL
jgi:hypothetical protein